MTVTVDDQTCTRQGTVVIGGGAADLELLVPAVVHAPGASNSQWRAALTCLKQLDTETVRAVQSPLVRRHA